MRRIVIIGIFFVTAIFLHGADLLPGSQLFYLGQGANGFALGGNGITQFGSIEGLFYNPAVTGDIRRISASFSGGTTGVMSTRNAIFGSLAASFPTRFGVFSGGATFLKHPDSTSSNDVSVGTVLGINAALAKRINDFIFIGFGLRNYYGWERTLGFDWALNLDIGLYFKTFPNIEDISFTDASNKVKYGVGFYDFAAGIVVRNVTVVKTLTYGTNYLGTPPFNIGAGATAKLIKFEPFKLGLLADVTVVPPINVPFNITANGGLELSFIDTIYLRGGILLSASNFGVPYAGLWTAGLGLRFKRTPLFNSDINFDLAVVPQNFYNPSNSSDYGIYGTLGVGFGYYDDAAPKLEITTKNQYFSPNFDGSQDTMEIELGINDNEMVNGWKIEVRDEKGEVIKEFQSQDKLKEPLDFLKFFGRIGSSEESVEIPRMVAWDGIEKNGQMVKDGNYSYTVSAWDKNNNTNKSAPAAIVIDRVFPEVKLASDPELIFSPNNDGMKDVFIISNTTRLKTGDIATGRVINEKGEVIKTFSYTNEMPAVTAWDGTMDNGADAPEGLYQYKVEVKNLAGNNIKNEIKAFRLVRRMETMTVNASAADFSPNSDGAFDTATFTMNASSTANLAAWTLAIIDKSGKVRKEFKGDELPLTVVWDGTGNDGKTLPDGDYRFYTELRFTSGNHPVSATNSIIVDKTAPTVAIKPSDRAFSPDGDGVKDEITFTQAVDPTTVKPQDRFDVMIKNDKGIVVFQKEYGVSDLPGSFAWNGHIDNDASKERSPDGLYVYSVRSKDPIGNARTALIENITLDTGKKEVVIDADTGTFGPGKRRKESINFITRVSEPRGITRTVFEIADAATKTMAFALTNNKEAKNAYEWDGRNMNGTIVPDGQYKYRMVITYDSGKEARSLVKTFNVDTVPPLVAVTIADKAFSPNGDGKKEALLVHHKRVASALSPERFESVFKDAAGRVVRRFTFADIPETLVWDGRDQNGAVVKQGAYTYELTGIDDGENETNTVIAALRLVTEFEKLTVACNDPRISTSSSALIRTATLSPSLSSISGLTKWTFTIADKSGKVIWTSNGNRADLPKDIAWPAVTAAGASAADDDYTGTFTAVFSHGNEIISETPLTVDSIGPAIRTTIHPPIFSPDGDGDNDTLFVGTDIDDTSGVEDWKISVLPLVDDKLGTNAFKTWKGKNAYRELITWDGYGDEAPAGSKDDKYLVESASDYAIVVTAKDKLGNTITTKPELFKVDILVIRTPYGYKIRISSIQFDYNSADVKAKYEPILTRLAQVLNKFKQHAVKIEGHTDMVGPDKYNNELSLKRASSVLSYLVERGLERKRFTAEGVGKQRPLFEEKADDPVLEEHRARNRRVEFYLKK